MTDIMNGRGASERASKEFDGEILGWTAIGVGHESVAGQSQSPESRVSV